MAAAISDGTMAEPISDVTWRALVDSRVGQLEADLLRVAASREVDAPARMIQSTRRR